MTMGGQLDGLVSLAACCCFCIKLIDWLVTCKIKHLQNICKNVLVFYFTCNHGLSTVLSRLERQVPKRPVSRPSVGNGVTFAVVGSSDVFRRLARHLSEATLVCTVGAGHASPPRQQAVTVTSSAEATRQRN